MEVFAIDLGNKHVKMKSKRAEYIYPSSYISADNVGAGGLGSSVFTKNQTYKIQDEENEFIWGEELERYHLPEKMIDTYARKGRYTLKKVRRILEFAISRLAFDFPESHGSFITVHLVLGISISDGRDQKNVVNILKEIASQNHICQVNDVEVMVKIEGEDSVCVIPQFMGTIYDGAYDDNMQEISDFKNGNIGIVDIGGGTVLSSISNHLTPSPLGDERFEGTQNLINKIAQKSNITKQFLIEGLLDNQKEEFIYRPNRNFRDSKDITPIVLKEIENYTRMTIAPIITEVFPDFEMVDFIVISGGGAKLINKEALLDEIGREYYDHLIFVKEPEVSNVRGFYKAGLLLWGGVPSKRDEHVLSNFENNPSKKSTPVINSRISELTNILSNFDQLNDSVGRLEE